MRVIIAAAGAQAKWDNYLNVPSHLAPLTAHGGEPLLQRTIRQALAHTSDVHLTCPDDDRYAVWSMLPPDGNGVEQFAKLHIRTPDEPSEYASTRGLWAEDARTVLLLGDVYFTDAALRRIMADPHRRFRAYGRASRSRTTGCQWGELFASSWWPEQHSTMDRHLSTVHAARAAGTVTRPPGWMLLRAWQGSPLHLHRVARPWFVEIDDDTDDLDYPADYDRHPATRRRAA